VGKFDRLPDLADELVRLEVDVIAATTSPAAVAARNATRTIPIVMFVVGDPVALGLIASLARPGGNITGLTYSVGLQAFVKQLELLKETVPQGPPSGGPFESGQSRRRAHDKQREDRRPVNESGAAVPGGEVPTSSIAPSRRWSKSARKRSSCCRTRCSVCSGRGSQSLREKSRLPSMHGVRELVEAGT
jgi:putative ABC transport system substrate-binding protein